MKMNKLVHILITGSFILLFFIVGAQEKYPVNTDGSIINRLDSLSELGFFDIEEGKFYAFEAEIIEVYEGYLGKPIFSANFETGETIWVGSMLKHEKIKPGKKIRILGSVHSIIDQKDPIMKKYNSKDYMMLMFSFYDKQSDEGWACEPCEIQGAKWEYGVIPQTLR